MLRVHDKQSKRLLEINELLKLGPVCTQAVWVCPEGNDTRHGSQRRNQALPWTGIVHLGRFLLLLRPIFPHLKNLRDEFSFLESFFLD